MKSSMIVGMPKFTGTLMEYIKNVACKDIKILIKVSGKNSKESVYLIKIHKIYEDTDNSVAELVNAFHEAF